MFMDVAGAALPAAPPALPRHRHAAWQVRDRETGTTTRMRHTTAAACDSGDPYQRAATTWRNASAMPPPWSPGDYVRGDSRLQMAHSRGHDHRPTPWGLKGRRGSAWTVRHWHKHGQRTAGDDAGRGGRRGRPHPGTLISPPTAFATPPVLLSSPTTHFLPATPPALCFGGQDLETRFPSCTSPRGGTKSRVSRILLLLLPPQTSISCS